MIKTTLTFQLTWKLIVNDKRWLKLIDSHVTYSQIFPVWIEEQKESANSLWFILCFWSSGQ